VTGVPAERPSRRRTAVGTVIWPFAEILLFME
jgi:hypothetical protein